eukprot:s44_g44.t1
MGSAADTGDEKGRTPRLQPGLLPLRRRPVRWTAGGATGWRNKTARDLGPRQPAIRGRLDLDYELLTLPSGGKSSPVLIGF